MRNDAIERIVGGIIILFTIVSLFLFGILSVREIILSSEETKTPQVIQSTPIKVVPVIIKETVTTPTVVTETKEVVVYAETPNETDLTDAEIELLACLVQAEAGNQDQVGKRLVVDVVLNRVYSEDFPNTIDEVIYEKGQFATAKMLDTQIPTDDTFEAVYAELKERLDTNILFFQLYNYPTHGKNAYIHGDHYFSCAKEK